MPTVGGRTSIVPVTFSSWFETWGPLVPIIVIYRRPRFWPEGVISRQFNGQLVDRSWYPPIYWILATGLAHLGSGLIFYTLKYLSQSSETTSTSTSSPSHSSCLVICDATNLLRIQSLVNTPHNSIIVGDALERDLPMLTRAKKA